MDHDHAPRGVVHLGWLYGRVRMDGRAVGLVGGALLAVVAALPLVPFYPGFACPLRTLTGVPCPFCGMSTSVQETLRLDGASAFEANPGGILAVVLAVALLVVRPRAVSVPVAALVGLLGVLWVFELNRFGLI